MRGAKRPFLGTVTLERASAVADRLNEALDDARHASSHYRVVDALAPRTRIDGPDEADRDDDVSARSQRSSD
jgi:hypothetical protein